MLLTFDTQHVRNCTLALLAARFCGHGLDLRSSHYNISCQARRHNDTQYERIFLGL